MRSWCVMASHISALEILPRRQLSCDHLDASVIHGCSVLTHVHLKCWANKPLLLLSESHAFVFGFVSKGHHTVLVCSWLDHPVSGQINVPSYKPFPTLPPINGCTNCLYSKKGISAWHGICPEHDAAVFLQKAQEIGHCHGNGPRSYPSSCCMTQASLNQKVFVCRQAVIGMLATMITCSTCQEPSCHAVQ
jgi:hypothetical protein